MQYAAAVDSAAQQQQYLESQQQQAIQADDQAQAQADAGMLCMRMSSNHLICSKACAVVVLQTTHQAGGVPVSRSDPLTWRWILYNCKLGVRHARPAVGLCNLARTCRPISHLLEAVLCTASHTSSESNPKGVGPLLADHPARWQCSTDHTKFAMSDA